MLSENSSRILLAVQNLVDKYTIQSNKEPANQLISGLEQDLTEIGNKIKSDSELANIVNICESDRLSLLNLIFRYCLAIKRAGLFPYYITMAFALVLYNNVEKNRLGFSEDIVLSGEFERLLQSYDFQREPELLYLIKEHLRTINTSDIYLEPYTQLHKIKQAYEFGFKYEGVYRGCAQCVLASLFEVTGKSNSAIFRTASSMGGGSALCGDGSCGGYNGGLLMIGMYVGRRLEYISGDIEEKNKSIEICQSLHDKFIETYGNVVCKNIHECIFSKAYNLRIPDNRTSFQQAGAYIDKCNTVVGIACAWTMKLLIDNGFS